MKSKTKTITLFLFILFVFACEEGDNKTNKQIEPKFEWKKSTTHQNIFKTRFDSIDNEIEKGVYGYIDEVFISKNDTIFYQKKFNLDYETISMNKKGKMGCGSNVCQDSTEINLYNYYHPKYHPYYLHSDLHTLQSITKSVASTIIGTAIHDGKLSGVNESIYPFFTNYNLSDSIKNHLQSTTLQDILTMQLGLKWKEFGMSLEMETNVGEMEFSEDWVAYALKQPIESKPGIKWNYNSGASQLFSQIIKKATGQTIEMYGNQTLFQKLNIKNHYWKKTTTGLPDTEGGLYLKAEDLAKIGLLHLQNGIWNGERLLPENWTKEAFGKQVKDIYQDGGKEGYGYQWWITADEPPIAAGLGYGNQILVIIPEQNIIGVIYAWNVFDNKAKYIFRDFVNVLLNIEEH